MPAINIHQYHL